MICNIMIVAAMLCSLHASPWSVIVEREAADARVDPRIVHAIIKHESHGIPSVENTRGCVGLMQLCPNTIRACRDDRASQACEQARRALFDGERNIHVGTQEIASWRDWCKRTTGHAEAHHYLSGYAGTDRRGSRCGQRRVRGGWRDDPPHPIVLELLELAGIRKKATDKTRHVR